MRLPLSLLDSPFFQFTTAEELIKALGDLALPDEIQEIERMNALGLPPIASRKVLATMLGINPGLIWSFENRTARHYRSFEIPKGRAVRRIDAPKVALKVLQKWFGYQLEQKFRPSEHVYGFVNGRSHVDAAMKHVSATWLYSIDIENFFQSTPLQLVATSIAELGFNTDAAHLLSRISCLRGALAQGAPSSPVLSNICFRHYDSQLSTISEKYTVRLTRYADDIVFSGTGSCPEELIEEVTNLFANGPWRLSPHKTRLDKLPNRLKVHGLLVHGDVVRLTKGYRNRLRAYRHLLSKGVVQQEHVSKVKGHLNYGAYVEAHSRDI